MLSFFPLFLHVQPKGDTCMNKNVWTPMNNPSHIKICKSYRYSRRWTSPSPLSHEVPFPVIGDLRCGQNYIPAGWSHKQSGQGRPGGVVVYQYTQKKFAKIPKNTQNSSKYTQNYTQVYFIPEIQRKWYTEYPYLSCNIPYTRFKKPLYTVYPKTLADPVR